MAGISGSFQSPGGLLMKPLWNAQTFWPQGFDCKVVETQIGTCLTVISPLKVYLRKKKLSYSCSETAPALQMLAT